MGLTLRLADSLTEGTLAQPLERKIKLCELMDWLEQEKLGEKTNHVWYAQSQSNNIDEEYDALKRDLILPDWASCVLGDNIDAVNIWIGNERSISALHQGKKKFKIEEKLYPNFFFFLKIITKICFVKLGARNILNWFHQWL